MGEQNTSTPSRRSAAPKKKKKNQIPLGFLTVGIIIVIAILLNTVSSVVSFYWLTGSIFGFILQKGRFCFTASMRDPYLTGSTSITRAVIITFAITTIGFSAIKYGYASSGQSIPGMSSVVPIMVIAGGCASGTLMRVGEGFAMNALAFFFFIVGSLWGAHDFGFWKEKFISKGVTVFLPDVFGWIGAVVLQLLVLLTLYIVAEQYEKKRSSSH